MKTTPHQLAAALFILAGSVASSPAANIALGAPTATLWPGGAPYTFFDTATAGGGDTAAGATSINFDRSFGTLNVGSAGSRVVVRGLAWATLAGGFTATRVAATVTYLGADGVSGGLDDVVIGRTTNNVTASASAGTWVWVFDAPITNTITGLSNRFRINLAVDTGASGTFRFKTTSGTAAADVKLSVAGSSAALNTANPAVRSWVGNVNGTWDTATANWSDYADPKTYEDGKNVVLDDTLSASPSANTNLTLSATHSPASVVINNSAYDYSLSGGGLAGAMSLTKQGIRALTLNMPNSFTGGSTLTAGTVRLGAANALGTGPVTFNGGTLSSDGATARAVTNAITFTNSSVTLGDPVNSGPLTLSGPVDYAGLSIIQTCSSDVVLTGSQTNGGLNQKWGVGSLTYSNVVGTVSGANSQWQILWGDFILKGGTLNKAGGGIRIGHNGANGIARLIITNGAQVLVTGGGANLRVGNDQAPAANATSTNILDVAGTLSWQTNSGGIVVMGAAGALAQINLHAGGLLQVGNFLRQGTAVTELNFLGGTLAATTNTGNFMSNLTAVRIGTATGALIDPGANSITVAQSLTDPGASGGGLTKLGAGTLVLSGNNTYTGSTVISNGTLALSGAGTIASANLQLATGATFDVSAVTGGSYSLNGAGSLTLSIAKAGLSLTQSQVQAASLTAGGTLNVAASGDALSGGESFTLFNVTPGGTFSATNLPALGTGLNWFTANNYRTLSINRAPVAQPQSFSVAQGDAASLVVIGGKFSPTDADPGDAANLMVAAVGAVSPASAGTAGFNSTNVTFTAANNFSGTATFSYTVSDVRGGSDTKTVTVTVTPATSGANLAWPAFNTPGVATLNGLGIPGHNYQLQYTENLNPVNWQDVTGPLATAAASSSNGALSLVDTNAGGPSRFYRTRHVSAP